MRLGIFYPSFEYPHNIAIDCRSLTEALARQGVSAVVFCRPGPDPATGSLVSAFHSPTHPPFMLADIASLTKHLRAMRSSLDALLLFGGFRPANAVAGLVAHHLAVPYIVSPDGNNSPALLNHGKRVRKRIYWRTVERSLLNHARAIHVLSAFEQECMRRLGIQTPTFTTTKGLPPEVPTFSPEEASSHRGQRQQGRSFLYLGRLDIWQKGLDYLIEGFADALSRDNRGQRLVLVGPPQGDSIEQLHVIIARAGLREGVEVVIRPPVSGQAKWDLYKGSDVLILVSRNEGLPRVIREGLALGLPMVVTRRTNMGETITNRGIGWCVAANREGVRDGILAAIAADDFQTRSKAAVSLAQELTWDNVAADFIAGLRGVL